MRRVVIGMLAAALAALLVVLGGVSWLLYSNGGAHWLLGQVQARVPGELRIERLGGSLASAIGLGARGGCMPVRPAPLDLQAPDAGHDGRPADSKALPGDQSAADG